MDGRSILYMFQHINVIRWKNVWFKKIYWPHGPERNVYKYDQTIRFMLQIIYTVYTFFYILFQSLPWILLALPSWEKHTPMNSIINSYNGQSNTSKKISSKYGLVPAFLLHFCEQSHYKLCYCCVNTNGTLLLVSWSHFNTGHSSFRQLID